MQCDFLGGYLLLYDLPDVELAGSSSTSSRTHDGQRPDAVLPARLSATHPMAVLTGLVGGMSAFYPDSINLRCEGRDVSRIG